MKQIIQSYKTGEMTVAEAPCPQRQRGMVLVETRASVISAGTEKMLVDLARQSLLGKARARPDLVRKVIDTAKREGVQNTLQKVRSKLDTPIPLGYSCAGVVREAGPGVDEFLPGDLVGCGGAGYANHAEMNLVPKNLCARIPLNSSFLHSFEEAAFAAVGAIALQGVRQAALCLGEKVCVIGLGLLGQLAAQLCVASGCRVIGADIDPSRLELVKKLGGDEAVLSRDLEEAAASFTGGVGVDAVVITASCSDSSLIELAGRISRMKGRVVVVGLVGMQVPRDIFYKKELDIRLSLSYGPGRYDPEFEERGHDYPIAYVRWTEQRNMQAFLDLTAAGRIDVRSLITHRFAFEQVLDAYDLILKGREPYLGVVLEYGTDAGYQASGIRNSTSLSSDLRHPAPDLRYPTPVIRHPIPGTRQPTSDVQLGLIGAGNFARGILLPAFKKNPKVSFRGVATARGMTARAVARQYGFSYCAESIDEIIEDPSINAVVVATRHDLHGPTTLKALQAGKHVFVEKPLCLHIEEMEAILDHYEKTSQNGGGSIVMVGFNRRFSRFVRKLKSHFAARSAPLVASYRINAGFVPKDSWIQDPVEGGGRILGEVCHFVDTLRCIVGSPVQGVQAACVRSENALDTNRDCVAVTLTYADGSLSTILYYACGSSAYPKEHLEIASSGAVAVLDDYCRLDIIGRDKQVIRKKQDKGFEAEVEAFVKSVAEYGAFPIPLDEMIETTRITFAIHEALNTAKTIWVNGQAGEG
ncbi:MAG TPA: bi-domain-containing oxidoreductase [Syntrophobacteraceae bacterium]|nr:bi-domain-containing oxidoreductase [Syntrophobacteraceae bacterium]